MDDLTLAQMREEQGDMLMDMGKDPILDYVAAASLFAEKKAKEDIMRVAQKIEGYGDFLDENKQDTKSVYHLAAAFYAQQGSLADMQKVEKKLEKLNPAGSLEDRLKESLRIARVHLEERKIAYQKEKKEVVATAAKGVITNLIEVLDTFEIALKSLETADQTVKDGMQLVQKQLYLTLQKEGLEKIEAKVGDKFDPVYHAAEGVVCIPSMPDGSIIAVNKSGYRLNGQMLRAVKVIVNQKPE